VVPDFDERLAAFESPTFNVLAGLPWRLVPIADYDNTRGHGRGETRTLKILSVSTGIAFPTPHRRCRSVAAGADQPRTVPVRWG
jgi:hypothetical protein